MSRAESSLHSEVLGVGRGHRKTLKRLPRYHTVEETQSLECIREKKTIIIEDKGVVNR